MSLVAGVIIGWALTSGGKHEPKYTEDYAQSGVLIEMYRFPENPEYVRVMQPVLWGLFGKIPWNIKTLRPPGAFAARYHRVLIPTSRILAVDEAHTLWFVEGGVVNGKPWYGTVYKETVIVQLTNDELVYIPTTYDGYRDAMKKLK